MLNKLKRPLEAKTDPHRLGRNYLRTHGTDALGRRTLHFYRGEFCRWEDGRYRVVSPEDMSASVNGALKNAVDSQRLVDAHGTAFKVTNALVANVINALKGQVLVAETVEQPCWLGPGPQRQFLAFRNGLLDLEGPLDGSAELLPPTPEWFSTVVFPYEYHADATCPEFERFVTEMLEGDEERIALLQEWFGYNLTPDTRFQKLMMLEGEGANGKSVVLSILEAVLGTDNVSHVPLGAFGERFQLTPTLGKLANIAPEVDENERPNVAHLKQFVGGDRMYFDRKCISPVEAKPTARVTFATNNRPPFRDRSSGLWRRILHIPFRVTIPEGMQDRDLTRKLMTELPGIVNWALRGRERLLRQGRFTESGVSSAALKEYERESNPAAIFLTDYCEAGVGKACPCDHLYGAYTQYCRINGYTALNASEFGKQVKKLFPNVRRTRPAVKGNRIWAYQGVDCTYPRFGYVNGDEFADPAAA